MKIENLDELVGAGLCCDNLTCGYRGEYPRCYLEHNGGSYKHCKHYKLKKEVEKKVEKG